MQVIWELRHEYKLSLLLDVADLPHSTYDYYTKKQKEPDKHAELIKKKSAPLSLKTRADTATGE